MEPLVRIVGLDHIVLLCADQERSLRFYCDTLGLEGDRIDEWRAGEVPFPSVRIDQNTIIDLFARPDGGSPPADGANLDHFCVVVQPVDLDELAAHDAIDVVRGPQDHLYGARGYATSLYVRDPDGNTVELRSYD